MPTLPPDDLAILAAELADPTYDGLDDLQRFELFHAPSAVANPTPRPDVPRPVVGEELIGLLIAMDPATAGRLLDLPPIQAIEAAIRTQDRGQLATWFLLAKYGGAISEAQYDAMTAYLVATVPDPDWPATVPGPSRKAALFGPKAWTTPDGYVVDYVPLADFAEAR